MIFQATMLKKTKIKRRNTEFGGYVTSNSCGPEKTETWH